MRVLFLCTGNACRSQMAEGLCRAIRGELIEPFSAGVEKHGLDPRAVEVMNEIGIDISGQRSKTVDELEEKTFDYVITLCGHAREMCPFFPGPTKTVHRGFEDPPLLAKNASTEEEALEHYRRIRDQIREFVSSLPEALESDSPGLYVPLA